MISKIFLAAPLCIMGVVSAATPASALGFTGNEIKFKYFYILTAHESELKEGIGSFTIKPNPKPGTIIQDFYNTPIPLEVLGTSSERHGTSSYHGWYATSIYNNADPLAVEWKVFGQAFIYPGTNIDDPPRDVSASTFFIEITTGGEFISDHVSAIEAPGPLPILGAAAAFGWSRKLRKRLKSSKSEVISTTEL